MDEHTEHTNQSNGNGKGSGHDTPETMFDSLRNRRGRPRRARWSHGP